jgi:hypothetical protein
MRAETLKGHLDGILLAVLESEPRHGYAIMGVPVRIVLPGADEPAAM